MLTTPLGIVTVVRLVQSQNAHNPMAVTLSEMVTLVRMVVPVQVFLGEKYLDNQESQSKAYQDNRGG
jgi:hypothetical protein